MVHALIVDDNRLISRAIENCLNVFDFDSFDHAWTGAQAVEAATARQPDLVVVGETISDAAPVDVARNIGEQFGVPVLQVARGQCAVRRSLSSGIVFDGPFSLSEIGTAVACARAADHSVSFSGRAPAQGLQVIDRVLAA